MFNTLTNACTVAQNALYCVFKKEQDMLKIVNTVVKNVDFGTVTTHTVVGTAQLAGNSVWDYNYSKLGMEVAVKQITVFEEDDSYKEVYVTHNSGWQIYTDNGFEHSISKLLGFKVMFTEQGMQEDGYASMET